MKKIDRRQLSTSAVDYLTSRKTRLQAEGNPAAAVSDQWKSAQKTTAMNEVRSVLSDMASGRERCMYCEDSAGTDIEHFYPKSKFPDKAFEWPNYLLACSHCNSNLKRDKFPQDANGRPMLIDPTAEDPSEHLQLAIDTGEFGARTNKGLASVDVFGLNREMLSRGRRGAWVSAVDLILLYAKLRTLSSRRGILAAEEVRLTLHQAPFASVVSVLSDHVAKGGIGFDPALSEAMLEFPEIVG